MSKMKILTEIDTKTIGLKKVNDWKTMVGKHIKILYENEVVELKINDIKINNNKTYLRIRNNDNMNELWIELYHFINEHKISKLFKKRLKTWLNEEDIPFEIEEEINKKIFGYNDFLLDNITIKSNKKIYLRCKKCGKVTLRAYTPNKITERGLNCEYCSDGISYPEKFLISMLNQLDIDFTTQYSPKWISPKRYDLYIKDLNCIIEVNGGQHYYKNNTFEKFGGRTLEQEKENDSIKKEIALKNKIKYYITLDCRESNLNWIKNSIIKSEIANLLDLSKIDWLECDHCSQKSYKLETFNLYNKGLNPNDIAKKLSLASVTIRRYLREGSKLNKCKYIPLSKAREINIKKASIMWKEGKTILEISELLKVNRNTIRAYLVKGNTDGICKYNAKHEQKKSIEKNLSLGIEYKKRDIICLDNNEVYHGLEEVELKLGIKRKNVSVCCNGQNKTTTKDNKIIRFMFLEDYMQAIKNNTNINDDSIRKDFILRRRQRNEI